MKISVITPTFNRAETLKKSFQSVLEQSFPPFEHIIADNVSGDGTAAVVEEVYAGSLTGWFTCGSRTRAWRTP